MVSADILFRLRLSMLDNDAAALAFNQLFAAANVPEVSALIASAASEHKSFGCSWAFSSSSETVVGSSIVSAGRAVLLSNVTATCSQ